jgi:hypothetical protein
MAVKQAIVWGCVGAVLAASAAAIQPGCTGEACVGVGDPDLPSATIECPAGLLCYRGQCEQGCNAGDEHPTCPEGQACIPTLNICRRIDSVPTTADPSRPSSSTPKPTYALDGSVFVPSGLQPSEDAGDTTPIAHAVTHVVFVDIAQEEDWRIASHPKAGRFDVRAWDLGETATTADLDWRGDRPVLTHEPLLDNAIIERDCRYLTLTTVPSAERIDFGDVRIDDAEPRELHPPFVPPGAIYVATWAAGQYDVRPPVPADFLSLSTPRPADGVGPSVVNRINVLGSGTTVLTGGSAWPLSPDNHQSVPFALIPTPLAGEVDLAVPQVLSTPAQDLIFHWRVVTTGITEAMRVRVRIPAGDHEILCEVVEAGSNRPTIDRLPLTASLLERLRDDVGAGSTLPIYFERAQIARVLVPSPKDDRDELLYVHYALIWLRHTLIGSIRL